LSLREISNIAQYWQTLGEVAMDQHWVLYRNKAHPGIQQHQEQLQGALDNPED
jgi:hypothetical protein